MLREKWMQMDEGNKEWEQEEESKDMVLNVVFGSV